MADVALALALALGPFALLFTGLWIFSRWLGDTIRKAIDRRVRTDFWSPSDHSAWKGNGA